MSALDGLELHPVRIPMRHRFRQTDHREAVLIRGPAGWGEFSPFPEYPPNVTVRWLASALEASCSYLPEPKRERVPVNATVPVVSPELASALVLESGASTAKVKVGDPSVSLDDDIERLTAVRTALGDGGRIRVDVNAAWNLDEATENLLRLADFDLEYVEQPVATLDEMIELRRRTGIPLAADELVRLGTDPMLIAESGAADILVLKVQPMGGVGPVLDLARRCPLPVVISSALETSVGMYSGLLAASIIEHLPYACGLGTVALLAGDVVTEPLVSFDGFMEPKRREPEAELLSRWRPERDRADALVRRTRQVAEILA